MSITDKEFKKLLHDLKRIEKVIEIIAEEEKHDKRKIIADLLRSEFDRLFQDIDDVRQENKNESNFS
ncbi:MAG: hypothetical protein ACTSWG_13095 [Candidatus Helarchaeota archaeon]